MVRITAVKPVGRHILQLTLTDGRIVERDVKHLLKGKLFTEIAKSEERFRQVSAVDGTVEWPNGADLCPDVLIWGGPPPLESEPSASAEMAQGVSR